MDKQALLDKAVSFHGHMCGGLMIGFQAAVYAMELLDIKEASKDEEIVCVAENDSCGVDAIQAILGCSTGKGNLILRLRGKQAYSFFNRKADTSVRLVLKDLKFVSAQEKKDFMYRSSGSEIFDVKKPSFRIPEKALIFKSIKCSQCGEVTAEPWLRLKEGNALCWDCYKQFEREIQ